MRQLYKLLEDDETTLVPRASKGLEEEVERGIRIPFGRGFAGRIAATREPVRILNVAEADIVNPILRQKGLKSLLGVPLLVEGNVIGVLHVGTLQERAFHDEDVDLLQRAGDRAALVLYTDGLVERAGESLDAGLERLAATVRAGDDDLEYLGDELVDVMLPEGTGGDDAALLLARAMPLEDMLVARFPAEIESIPVMRRLLGRWLDEAGATRADVDDLSLACAEAAANAIEHAYGLAPGIVEIRGWTSDGRVTIAIRDFGNWRAPRGRHRGRGLLLMEGLADEVEVSRSDEGTTIELSRQLGAAAA